MHIPICLAASADDYSYSLISFKALDLRNFVKNRSRLPEGSMPPLSNILIFRFGFSLYVLCFPPADSTTISLSVTDTTVPETLAIPTIKNYQVEETQLLLIGMCGDCVSSKSGASEST